MSSLFCWATKQYVFCQLTVLLSKKASEAAWPLIPLILAVSHSHYWQYYSLFSTFSANNPPYCVDTELAIKELGILVSNNHQCISIAPEIGIQTWEERFWVKRFNRYTSGHQLWCWLKFARWYYPYQSLICKATDRWHTAIYPKH